MLHAVLVVEGGAHGFGVTGTQLEHLGNLDAAGTRKRQTAVGAAVTGLDDAQVGPFVHREIAALFGAHVVVVVLVRTDDPMADALQAAGSDDARALGQADRAHRALVQAEGFHFLVGEQLKPGNGALGFDLVELVVTGDEHHNELALGVLAGERLHRGAFGNAEELRELLDSADARGVDLLKLGSLVLRRAGQALASLGVRGVTAGAVHELRLARRGKRHELGRHLAADLATIGLDRAVIQATAIADRAVGAAHIVVGFLQRFLRRVEGVRVLHDELAAAEQAQARSDLVAELHLDLVERAGKLLVGTQLVADERRDELLMGGPEAEAVVVTVDEAHELGAVIVPAAGLVPQLRRLQRRHHDFLRADLVHFLAHDVLDLREHLVAKRQEGVHARSGLADHARAKHQLVARNFRVRGILLQRRSIELAHSHNFTHSFPISSINTSTMACSSTFRCTSPCLNTTPTPAPHATPMSASRASPGPLTTQPMTATFMGLVVLMRLDSTCLASSIKFT